jgi:hypothetical protein
LSKKARNIVQDLLIQIGTDEIGKVSKEVKIILLISIMKKKGRKSLTKLVKFVEKILVPTLIAESIYFMMMNTSLCQ